jgi:hypothetical protein
VRLRHMPRFQDKFLFLTQHQIQLTILVSRFIKSPQILCQRPIILRA